MSDRTTSIGQFMPQIHSEPIAQPAAAQPSAKSEKASNSAFDQILQERAAARTASSSPASSPSTFYAAPSSGQTESSAMLLPQTMPTQVAYGQDLEQAMIQNLQDYNDMKARQMSNSQPKTSPQPLQPEPLQPESLQPMPLLPQSASFPDPSTVRRNASAMSAQNNLAYIGDETDTNGLAAHSAMANTTQTAQQSPDDVQPVILTPEEARQLEALMNMSSLAPSNATPVDYSQPQAQTPETSAETKTETASKKKKGFFGAMGSFFKNLASGFSLGFYQPDNQPKPSGTMRVLDPLKKIFYEAPKNLFWDAPQGLASDIESKVGNSSSENGIATSEGQSRYRGRRSMRVDGNPYGMRRSTRNV